MFNLDHSIERWRQQMAGSGLGRTEILDELESHLREEVQAQIRNGVSAQEAFVLAVQRIGPTNNLKREFARTVTAIDHIKDAVFTLAGIPNYNLANTMQTSRIEPAWTTYLKAAAFLLPALLLATISAIWVVPKLQQICQSAGLPAAENGSLWSLTYSSIQIMLLLSNHGLLIAGAGILSLFVLEWRFGAWPRYRRATINFGAFILNTIILLAFFMMFVASIVSAPALSGPAK